MPTSSSALITVLGTLAGTALGLCASLANSWFNHTKSVDKERADRRRQRLEDLYATLLEVRRTYQDILGQAASKIHGNTFKDLPVADGIPPIIKTEMLVQLYFPELKPNLASFNKAKETIGKAWASTISGKFSHLSLPQKQQECDRFFDLYNEIDAEISRLHAKICEMIEA